MTHGNDMTDLTPSQDAARSAGRKFNAWVGSALKAAALAQDIQNECRTLGDIIWSLAKTGKSESEARSHEDRIAANIAARVRVAPAEGWLPIADAPRDGTRVDLRQDHMVALGCYWGAYDEPAMVMSAIGWVMMPSDFKPTHYRLSAPPLRHVDDMNDMVLMGLARDEAEARVKVLEKALSRVRDAIENKNGLNKESIVDTVWVDQITTAVDEIDNALEPNTSLSLPFGSFEEVKMSGFLDADPLAHPYKVGDDNAKIIGWERFFEGKDREACPFPPARRDLQREYREGWDEAERAAAKRKVGPRS